MLNSFLDFFPLNHLNIYHRAFWTKKSSIPRFHMVQETGIKTFPKKKKCKKAKWLSEEALQIAVKTREVESKGKKEKYTHLNVEFQRMARRDKKAFFSSAMKRLCNKIL